MRYIDLSVALQNDLPVDRPGNGPHIRYQHHHETFEALAGPFAGLRPEDLPDGEAWAVERIDLSTHNGTHMDAPWHYASTMDGGLPAATIDEVPLEWCHRPGVKLDPGRNDRRMAMPANTDTSIGLRTGDPVASLRMVAATAFQPWVSKATPPSHPMALEPP